MFNPKSVPWLKAGVRRFADMGPSGLNVNEISEEIGISKTSFYNFFGSKKEYIDELFDYWMFDANMKIVKMGYQKENTKESVRTIMTYVVFENYENEKFLSQLIAVQNALPIAKKYIKETMQFRMSSMTGLMARLGLSDAKAKKRAKSMVIYYLGIYNYYFDKEPSLKEKKEILNDVMEMFWPEVGSKDNHKKS